MNKKTKLKLQKENTKRRKEIENLGGYHSRDEEVEDLITQIQEMLEWQEKYKSPIESGLAVRFFNLKNLLAKWKKESK